jgi:hypothetical protein
MIWRLYIRRGRVQWYGALYTWTLWPHLWREQRGNL